MSGGIEIENRGVEVVVECVGVGVVVVVGFGVGVGVGVVVVVGGREVGGSLGDRCGVRLGWGKSG